MDVYASLPPSALAAKESDLYRGRISQTAFETLVGAFYGLAILAASVRLIVQVKIHRRLYLDDYFLIFACITLTAGTVLGYANVGALYWSEELNYNPSQFFVLLAQHVDIAAHINTYERLYYSWPALLWTTIFVVKFAYLAFFRRLIERIRPLFIYWKIIIGITVVSFPVCIVSVYVACTKHGLDAAKCLEPVYFHRALGLAIFDIILDVGTDLLIVSLPIRLLWSVKIKMRQKVIIGVFLSLNLFMAFTASVRVSGLKFRGTFDEVWLFAWQHIEASVAVAMISLTAFRSVFVAADASRAQRESPKKAWYSSSIEAIRRRRARQNSDEEATRGLPSIPGATLTGMRTFIQGGHHKEMSENSTGSTTIYDGEVDDWPLYKSRHGASVCTV